MSLPTRVAGICLHPNSLPSRGFGAHAFAFGDWLAHLGCSFPLGQTARPGRQTTLGDG